MLSHKLSLNSSSSLLLIFLVCVGIIINPYVSPQHLWSSSPIGRGAHAPCSVHQLPGAKGGKGEVTNQCPRYIEVLGVVQSDSHSEAKLTPLAHLYTITSTTNMLRRWLNGHAVEPHKHPQHRLLNIASRGARKFPSPAHFRKCFSPSSIPLDETKTGVCRYNTTP